MLANKHWEFELLREPRELHKIKKRKKLCNENVKTD